MMRDELHRDLAIGGVSVGSAVERVEAEVSTWSAKYQHITRAVAVKHERVIELETIFSKPTQEKPAPVAVVCVNFALDTQTQEITYRFERESVRHRMDGQCLAKGKFERWLDRITSDKMQVRMLHGLATPFEETRLAPPPQHEHEALIADVASSAEESDAVGITVSGRAGTPLGEEKLRAQRIQTNQTQLKGEEPSGLSTLLANIFDAADEEHEEELSHKEVADLLYATPLGLADWDIKLLLTTAGELPSGKIDYKPFVHTAPLMIEELLQRRAAYKERSQPSQLVTQEAIELCYGEEIEEATRTAREAFSSGDVKGEGRLSRHEFRTRLEAIGHRFSTQEVQMLMQMCKEDDFGQVPYDEFVSLMQHLRIDSLHNALIETDVAQLRKHLIILLRSGGMDDGGIVDVWNLKHILMSADQICLSRMQIHVILSIVHPNEVGEVDAEYFLRVACTVIPWMFDVARFMEKADMIAAEKAEAQKRAEQQELEAFTSGAMAARNRGAGEADEVDELQQKEPDKEQVEKILISSANHQDQNHRQAGTLEVSKFLEAMHPDQVAQCQLQDHELRGFIAEAEIEMRGNSQEIAYVEHIKTWVPIIFELRRSHVYGAILSKDWGFGADHLVDLRAYEAHFPLHSEHIMERPDSAASRRSGGFGGRRPSSRGDRRMSSRRSRSGSQMLHSDDLAGLRQSQRGSRASSARRQRPQSGKGSRERSLSRAGSTRSITRANSLRALNRMQSGDSLDSMASRRSSARGGGSR